MSDPREGNLGDVIDRRVQVYGDPIKGFTEIATMWSVLFEVEIPAWKVPIAQALMKVVRMKTSPDYSDHSDDIEGYLDLFRTIIGPDMIEARTVNEYIAQKWPAEVGGDDPTVVSGPWLMGAHVPAVNICIVCKDEPAVDNGNVCNACLVHTP